MVSHSLAASAVLLVLCSAALARPNYSDDLVLYIDGEKVDDGTLEKQKAEGNVLVEGNRTRVETDLSELETEIGDQAVYAGGEVVQTYKEGNSVDEDVRLSGHDNEQDINIQGNRNQTSIDIDIQRENKEDIRVEFDVDHDGEEVRFSTDEETGEESSKYRLDTQYLDVYVEEQYNGVVAPTDDDIDIDLDVDLDEIDLDDADVVRIEIDLIGSKDGSTANDSNVYIDAVYRNDAREDNGIDQGQFNPINEELEGITQGSAAQFDDIRAPTTASYYWDNEFNPADPCPETGITFTAKPQVIIKRGDPSSISCSTEGEYELQYTWMKMDAATGRYSVVGDKKKLQIESPGCGDAGIYICQVSLVCEGVINNYQSDKISVVVDNGVIINPMCQIFGDPHVVTYDNKFYSFQGECTYLLSMDAERGDWIVYGRFVACGTGTCMESIVVYSQGFMIELQRGWVINLNGEKVPIKQGVPYQPHRSISIYFNGYEISVELRRPQIYLIWDGIMNFKLEIASNKQALGLCGNNNGDPGDDFMSWYGDILTDSNAFGHLTAVDRAGVCVQPQHTTLQQADTAAATQACNKVLQSDLFSFVAEHLTNSAKSQGKDVATITSGAQLLDTCVFDYLSGMEILDKQLSPECYAGYHYVSMARRFGLCLPEGWQQSVNCITKEQLQDLTITTGCPYSDLPAPFANVRADGDRSA